MVVDKLRERAAAPARNGAGRKDVGGRPLACVLGDTDLIRPLGLAGIRCAVLARPDSPKAQSRFVDARVKWADNWDQTDRMLENLLDFAATAAEPPILFFQNDGDLLFVSRNRSTLARRFRFRIVDRELVEALVDKSRFVELAHRSALPIPATSVLRVTGGPHTPDLPSEYPVIVKPLTRRDAMWRPLAGLAKALVVESPSAMAELWPRLVAAEQDVLVQELIEGGEERVESYHAYVDDDGAVAGDFTGRKIRTLPPRFGQTTALEITDTGDVRELGRRCVDALGLRGVLKIDFKRAPSGRLFLLEVNPRFNLWHLPGAVAGVNLPALVYADLAGTPRPPTGPARAGVRWSHPSRDLASARLSGEGTVPWLAWQARCETRHMVAADDPMPLLRGFLWRRAKRRLRRYISASSLFERVRRENTWPTDS
jgi:D-aspartate ligase